METIRLRIKNKTKFRHFSAGEFIVGAINKNELIRIRKALNSIRLIPVHEMISVKALELLERYSLTHNLSVPDAFIAATALINDIKLYTLNIKDFRFIEKLQVYGKC